MAEENTYLKYIKIAEVGIIGYFFIEVVSEAIYRVTRDYFRDTAKAIKAFVRITAAMILAAIILSYLSDDPFLAASITTITGLVVAFASQTVIGNMIAGLYLSLTRPFKIGDRIFFNGQFADVIAVDLIYTRMKTLDNVMVSVPNQNLLTTEIDNYGKRTIVRRSCSISVGYELTSEQVEKALLEAAGMVDQVLESPEPYVWITGFGDFAIEYTLYVFVNQVKRIPKIDSNLKKLVLIVCKKQGIDISTPRLLRTIEE